MREIIIGRPLLSLTINLGQYEMIRIKILTLLSLAFELPGEYFEVRHLQDNQTILPVLAQYQPDLVLCQQRDDIPTKLQEELDEKLLVLTEPQNAQSCLRQIEEKITEIVWPSEQEKPKMVSIITASYCSGEILYAVYSSLAQQTSSRWEWVIVDDDSDDKTWEVLHQIASWDSRVKIYAVNQHRGNIGALKRDACRLACGEYLIELDHDDFLAPTAVERVRQVFDADPDLGMIYSNYAYIDDSLRPICELRPVYKYRKTTLNGQEYLEVMKPDISALQTSEWVTSYLNVPFHMKAFRASELHRLGGYNAHLKVSDDWEIVYRFYLYSRIRHINELLYLYCVRRAKEQRSNTTSSVLELSFWLRDLAIKHYRLLE